jgi:hypothetical protein
VSDLLVRVPERHRPIYPGEIRLHVDKPFGNPARGWTGRHYDASIDLLTFDDNTLQQGNGPRLEHGKATLWSEGGEPITLNILGPHGDLSRLPVLVFWRQYRLTELSYFWGDGDYAMHVLRLLAPLIEQAIRTNKTVSATYRFINPTDYWLAFLHQCQLIAQAHGLAYDGHKILTEWRQFCLGTHPTNRDVANQLEWYATHRPKRGRGAKALHDAEVAEFEALNRGNLTALARLMQHPAG